MLIKSKRSIAFLLFFHSVLLLAQPSSEQVVYYANLIQKDDLSGYLKQLASDKFQGRETGEYGQKVAAAYIASNFKSIGLKPLIHDTSFLQSYLIDSLVNKVDYKYGENVIACIEGSDKKDEVVVFSAHYDHLGIKEGLIYYGADDDGSGTASIIELAKVFQQAKKEGHGPRRTLLFIAFSGEEEGLLGSDYYIHNPVFSLSNTMVDLNIDMIGRIDEKHKKNPSYLYIIGSDKLSSDLHRINERANAVYCKLKLDYTYNSRRDPNHFYYRSDHYNFARNNIPVIFYFNGVHKDYHKPTDTVDKIDFDRMQERVRLVFYTAWELANREERIKLNDQ